MFLFYSSSVHTPNLHTPRTNDFTHLPDFVFLMKMTLQLHEKPRIVTGYSVMIRSAAKLELRIQDNSCFMCRLSHQLKRPMYMV